MASRTISDNHTVTSAQVHKALLTAFRTKRPVFLWGPPGIGKSEVVRSVTEQLKGHLIDLRMAQMEPTDIRGIPFYNKDKTVFVTDEDTGEIIPQQGTMDWAQPIDLPDEKLASKYPIVVLFLDEMNSAPPGVQAAGYQLVLDRRVGKYKLPDNVVIVAAGNRASDKGVTYRMPTPLSNRFVHIEMRYDFASWQDWAVQNRIHKDVVGYLSFSKGDGYQFDSKGSSHAFATPRSWSFVSDLLTDEDNLENDTLFTLVAGAIGEGLAVKFMAHRKVSSQMPNPADILSGKVTDLKTKEVSAMYALTTAMCYELKDAYDKAGANDEFHAMFDHYLAYMLKNFETELGVMGARLAMKTYGIKVDPARLKNFNAFHSKYAKFVLDDSYN